MKESAKVAKLRKLLKGRAIVYKNSGGRWAKSGRPDLEIVFRHRDTGAGVVAFIELKQEGEKPTPIQLREIASLLEHGANATWTARVDAAIDYLRSKGL